MMEITKKEMIEIMENVLYYCRKDVSDPHHDIREYQRLDDKDLDDIAEDVLEQIDELFSKKRSAKIEKIKSNINYIPKK